MEPNKLEKQIREKLSAREIQPSAQAWDRLDAMLSVAENKKPKRKYWLYIAASIIGFVFVGLFVMNQSEQKAFNNSTNQIIVTTDAPKVDSAEVEIKSLREKLSNQSPSESLVETEKSIKKRTVIASNQNQETAGVSKKKKTRGSTTVKTREERIREFVKVTTSTKEAIVEAKTSISNVEETKITKSPTILINAESNKEVVANQDMVQKTKRKSSLKIDPAALLDEIDGELELTFRQKVLKNFQEVKTVVVTRNQE
jgi:hypothetical protein